MRKPTFDSKLFDRAMAETDLKKTEIVREKPETQEQVEQKIQHSEIKWRRFILGKRNDLRGDQNFEIKFEPLLQTIELTGLPYQQARQVADNIVLQTPGIIKTDRSYTFGDFEAFKTFRNKVKEGRETLKILRQATAQEKRQHEKKEKNARKQVQIRESELEKILESDILYFLKESDTESAGIVELSWTFDITIGQAKRVCEIMQQKGLITIKDDGAEVDPVNNKPIAKIYRLFIELNKKK